MPTKRKAYKDLTNDAKVQHKIRKVKQLFTELSQERHSFAEGLITNFAVCSVTLERLVDEINTGEVIEDFVQGSQKLRRENPAIRAYNSTIKSFSALSKNLLDLLPDTERDQIGEALVNFAVNPAKEIRK
jgi:hypothetical protein